MPSGIVNVILICTEIFRQHSIRMNVIVVKADVEKFSLSVKKKKSCLFQPGWTALAKHSFEKQKFCSPCPSMARLQSK